MFCADCPFSTLRETLESRGVTHSYSLWSAWTSFVGGRRAVGEADGAEVEEREDGEFAVVDGESGRIDADKGGLPVDFLPGGFEDSDVGEVAVTLCEIESVADDEFVGNFETDKIGLEGDLTAAFFVEQYTHPETGGTHAAHHASDE